MELRRILSENIKIRRRILGFSQEKLAELADLSTQTINDIEGCRTWVSDKTLIKLSTVLKLEVYRLLMPPEESLHKELGLIGMPALTHLWHKIKADVDNFLEDKEFSTAVLEIDNRPSSGKNDRKLQKKDSVKK